MGHPISTIIGIRTGGVFAYGDIDRDNLKKALTDSIKKLEESNLIQYIDLNRCMSHELFGGKGSYIVVAGVFNSLNYAAVSEFGKILSHDLGVEIMVMTWDEQIDEVQCNVFLDGNALCETNENPVGRILRRLV